MNSQYRHYQRQYQQEVDECRRQVRYPPTLTRARQPIPQPQQPPPLRQMQIPPAQQLQKSPISPVHQIRQTDVQQITPKEMPTTPLEPVQQQVVKQAPAAEQTPLWEPVRQTTQHQDSPKKEESPPMQSLRQTTLPRHSLEEEQAPPMERLWQSRLQQRSCCEGGALPVDSLWQPSLKEPSSQEEQVSSKERLRQSSTQPRNLSPERRQLSPKQASLSPRPSRQQQDHEQIKEHPQSMKEKMQTDYLESVKKSLDYSNTDYMSGCLYGEKVKKKLTKREWRRRQNMHLRRILAPKNALIVLNEMLPSEKRINQFKVEPAPAARLPYLNDSSAHSFCAELTADGVTYKGYGINKLAARNDAAEQVFRDLILKHMVKLQRGCEGPWGSAEEHEGGKGEEIGEEDETLPMIQLASFALHKLFEEWECDGHKVPQLKVLAPLQTDEECEPCDTLMRPPKPYRALPINAATMHPCMLLTYMRPDLQYRDLTSIGDRSQTTLYTMGIEVDGRTYIGRATNKRDARKEAARVACTKHFGVKFTNGTPTPTPTSTPAPAPASNTNSTAPAPPTPTPTPSRTAAASGSRSTHV